ncbi:MAG: hypothetical protein R3D60_06410 [Paracoccaceae bacterium]
MKPTLSLLVATTALAAALGVPAITAFATPRMATGITEQAETDDTGVRLWLAAHDDNHRHRERRWPWSHDDDDDDDDHHRNGHDDDDDDDDGGRSGSSRRNPAPAGTVAPPQNGLFGTGTPPRVQMN